MAKTAQPEPAIEPQPVPEALQRVFELPPGVIGIVADSTARYTSFWQSVRGTLMPPGTLFHDAVGTSILHGWNEMVAAMLTREPDNAGHWMWMLGDDHTWPPDMLVHLLEHDVDIVVPIVLQKQPPFQPVLFSDRYKTGRYRQLVLEEYPDGGMIQVEAAGSAGMLVQRRVFETLKPPWFEMGQLQSDETGEDVLFCQKAKDAGFKVWCDMSRSMGHTSPATMYASLVDGEWGVTIEIFEEPVGRLARPK